MEIKQLFMPGHVALFLMLELVLYIANEQRAMILTGIVFAIFALIFFLFTSVQNNNGIISLIPNPFKPHHLRVKKITLGNTKAPNNAIIRIEEKNQKVSDNESSRNSGGDNHSFKTSTPCIIKLHNATD
jgi:hypothetical protein